MKLEKLLLAVSLMFLTLNFAQDSDVDPDRECKRMRFLAGEELKIKNYKGAVSYYIKGEKICGGYDAANYKRLIGSLRNTINSTKDKEKTAYVDTLVNIYNITEEKGFYDKKDDLLRASYILQSSNPNREKADELFRSGIATNGTSTGEGYVSYFYYNTYAMYTAAPEDKKAEMKKRMISDYFELSSLISKANMSVKTQETITGYFNAVVKDCNDIVPELKGYIENLPTDPEVKKAAVMNFITLLDKKECSNAPEYSQLIDIYVEIDPTSLDAQLMKAKNLAAKKKYSQAIATLKTAKGIATNDSTKQEINYMIANTQYRAGSYTAAYNTGKSISGNKKGAGLAIAGKAVAANANNCGVSSFDRACNYIYAVQLLEKARALGESVGGTIANYKKHYPTKDQCFQNGNPDSVTLSCYGVTVKPCN